MQSPILPQSEVYRPQGLLAVAPTALGQPLQLVAPTPAPAFVQVGDKAIVRVAGPLSYNGAQGLDTYAGIRGRVQLALASTAAEVIIHFSSPGGDVDGCFDGAHAIRADAQRAGKKLIAFTDAQACSSAYRWACAADEIVISETATIGSIGVIAVLPDLSGANAAMGVVTNIITSGERKADGNPMAPMSEAARLAIQQSVDSMAEVFFQHVAERRGLDIESVRALQAGVFVGHAAVAAGLADSVSTLDALLARSSTDNTAQERKTKDSSMADEDKKKEPVDARSALVAASEDPEEKDEVKRARARRALAAYDAEFEDEKKDEKKEDAKASAQVAALVQSVQSLSAKVSAYEAKAASDERAAFLATRPDLTEETIKSLAGLPLATVKAIVSTIKAPPPANPHLAALGVTASVNGIVPGADGQPTALSPEASRLDQLMGFTATASTVVNQGNVLQLGVRAPKAK